VTEYKFTQASAADLAALKLQYRDTLAAPLDGMWEHFTSGATHHAITDGAKTIGHCVINSEHKLLQFFVSSGRDMRSVFSQMLTELTVTGAFLASFEQQTLALAMDHQKSVAVHALMYHLNTGAVVAAATFPADSKFRLLELADLKPAVAFGAETLGADAGWLSGYFSDLINKGQLYGLLHGGNIIATGECRASESQKPYADVGMVVSKNCRGQGVATNILRQLLHVCAGKDLKAICSTERTNIAAQKAISKAGFSSSHRMLEFGF